MTIPFTYDFGNSIEVMSEFPPYFAQFSKSSGKSIGISSKVIMHPFGASCAWYRTPPENRLILRYGANLVEQPSISRVCRLVMLFNYSNDLTSSGLRGLAPHQTVLIAAIFD